MSKFCSEVEVSLALRDKTLKIALVGDFNPASVAHSCIPKALEISAKAQSLSFEPVWIATDRLPDLTEQQRTEFDGFWCVPGSPYKNRAAVLQIIRFARLSRVPFLGTCAGCQHAVLEFAVNELGISNAGLEEDEPETTIPITSALICRLTDESQKIELTRDSKLGGIYDASEISEEYRCGFGINPKYAHLFSNTSLKFSAFNEERIPQAIELSDHPFFIGTAFQPERSSRSDRNHPLIHSFVRAIAYES
jgi:CTP synthase (UTP-ammonia lyase)